MPDYSACPCADCIHKEIGIYNNPCKDCCAFAPPKGSLKLDYPSFVKDFRVKVLKTEDYFGVGEFKLVD